MEANAAQNTLQKEITVLRDTNRTLQLKLRDIEVANDDFERQARNTSSSLENLESNYNVAIERAVMMEEEIKIGEQERENLRIETQRLRDDLSDLKIEAEIMQDKLKKQGMRKLPSISTDITAPNSPSLAGSPDSAASSPMVTTPPDTKSVSTTDTVSETPTPPSPPISEASAKVPTAVSTPMNPPSRIRVPSGDMSTTPKPARYPAVPRSIRGPSIPVNSTRTAQPGIRPPINKSAATRGLPNSSSLTHIRSLTAQMQRLEQRVQSARSKLPAPVSTPPQHSPRNGSAMGHSYIPSSVTIRSRKRAGGSTVSGTSSVADDTPSSTKHVSRLSTAGISRLSFGLPSRESREASESSRPSSRASTTSFARPDRPSSRTDMGRPGSRASLSGARTPLGHYSQSSLAESRRPRSSIGGSFGASHGHGHSQSVCQIDLDESRELDFGTPSRRSTFSKCDLEGMTAISAIPAPKGGAARRTSGGIAMAPSARRTSTGVIKEPEKKADTNMKPPSRPRKLSGVGETF